MKGNFMDAVQEALAEADVSITENGAVGYKTTGKALLDLNFAVSSLRNNPRELRAKFAKAAGENLPLAVVWLFFARDIRGGMGERYLFRECLMYIAQEWPDKARQLLKLVPEYGRWDDLWCLMDTKLKADVVDMVREQLYEDTGKLSDPNASVSLLAKWMPSENASSRGSIRMAKQFANELHVAPSMYRKMLAKLRKRIAIVESQMSANKWDKINYEAVPSKANLVYKDAFMRHDHVRRTAYLDSLSRGDAKINATTLYPYEIFTRVGNNVDDALEAMWQALPNTMPDGADDVLVVVDGSGSMLCRVGGGNVTAWDVANSLGLYFAEKLRGPFSNRFITFSSTPEIVDLRGAHTLCSKKAICHQHTDCTNTDIEKTFDLILSTAIKNNASQRDLPGTVLIISDMEFDAATWDYCNVNRVNQRLFDVIGDKFNRAGYRMPRLVFWNVNSRTGTIPVKENELGVALVSGFSPTVANMVLSGKLDPYDAMLDALSVERYDAVREIVKEW